MLDNQRTNGLDVAFGKYEVGNKVMSYILHRGANQLFMVNNDHSISPCLAPELVWGF